MLDNNPDSWTKHCFIRSFMFHLPVMFILHCKIQRCASTLIFDHDINSTLEIKMEFLNL